MSDFVFGALALVGIVIVAMAISANKSGAIIVQAGLAIAIIALLVRSKGAFPTAFRGIETKAIGLTGKQAGS